VTRSYKRAVLGGLLLALGASGWAASAKSVRAPAAAYHIVDRLPGPDGGWDYVRVDDRTHQVLVTRGGAVMSADTRTGKVNPAFAPGVRLHIAMPVGDGGEVLLTNGGGDAAVFVDAVTGAELARIATGKEPDAAAYDPRRVLVLVVDHSGGDVVLADARTHARVGAITVGGELEEAVVDRRGRAFVNVESLNQIAVLDLDARKVVARWPLPGCDGPTGLAYDARDDRLIAACDGQTVLVDSQSGKVVQSLATGAGADGVAYDPVRRLAFVPAGHDGQLAVIAVRGGRGEIVQRLQTRKGARTVGLDERTGRLYLPSADYLPAEGGQRPKMKPGSFRLLVVAP
jgi:DNA-binding beta-propeller fold protein YncE